MTAVAQTTWFARMRLLLSIGAIFGLLAGILALAPSERARATTIPRIFNYQAKVTNTVGVTVPNGALSVAFVIYDAAAAGTCLWSAANTDANIATIDCGAPGQIMVTATDGVFSVLLGDTTGATQNTMPAFSDAVTTLYLGVRVGADAEMTPRKRIVAELLAQEAADAELLDGFNSSQAGGANSVLVTTAAGDLDMSTGLILNIGAAGTDFTAGGGLTLAEILVVNDDVDVNLAAGENLALAATVAPTGSLFTVSSTGFGSALNGLGLVQFSLAAPVVDGLVTTNQIISFLPSAPGEALDTVNVISINGVTTASGILRGINFTPFVSGAGTEDGVSFSTGWDSEIVFDSADPIIEQQNASTLTFMDGAGNTLLSLVDAGATSTLTVNGNLLFTTGATRMMSLQGAVAGSAGNQLDVTGAAGGTNVGGAGFAGGRINMTAGAGSAGAVGFAGGAGGNLDITAGDAGAPGAGGGAAAGGRVRLTGTAGTGGGMNGFVQTGSGVDPDSILGTSSLFVQGSLEVDGSIRTDGLFTIGDGGDTGDINTSDWDITSTGVVSGIASIASDNNQTAFPLNIPVSGVDAGAHTLSLQIDGNTGLSIAATGNGAGGVGARTIQIGVSAAADIVTIGDADADVSITDPQWSVTGPGAASFASLSLAGTLDMMNNLIVNIGAAGTDFTAGGGLTIAGTSILTVAPTLSPADGTSTTITSISGTINESGGGVHPRLAGLSVTAPIIVVGAAGVTEAASLYVSDAPSAAGATNYAILVDAGDAVIDANAVVGGSMSRTETLANAGFVMGGDDLFVAGLAGIEGNIYTDGSFIAGATTTYADASITNTVGNFVIDAAGQLDIRDSIVDTTGVLNIDDDTTWLLGAAQKLTIDADTTDHTDTAGVIDIDLDTSMTDVDAINIDLDADMGAGESASAISIDVTDPNGLAADINAVIAGMFTTLRLNAADGAGSGIIGHSIGIVDAAGSSASLTGFNMSGTTSGAGSITGVNTSVTKSGVGAGSALGGSLGAARNEAGTLTALLLRVDPNNGALTSTGVGLEIQEVGIGGSDIGIDFNTGSWVTGIDLNGPTLTTGINIGATTDITTPSGTDLTVTAGGTGDVILSLDADTPLIFSQAAGGTDITTMSGEALTILPGGTGDIILAVDGDSQVQVLAMTAAPAVDMLSIDNSAFPTVTNQVHGIEATFFQGAAVGSQQNNVINAVLTTTTGDAGDEGAGLKVDIVNTSTAGTQEGITIFNLATSTAATENFIIMRNQDGIAVANAIQIDATAGSPITTAINIETPEVTTDIRLQNDEVIENNTDGTISFTDGANTLVSIMDQGTQGQLTVEGMVCVRSATACPAFAAGRLYVDTAGTVGGDDPGDVFDLAEYYPATEPVEPGDVLVIDRAANIRVRKSQAPYEPALIGAASTSPAIAIEDGWFAVGGITQTNPRKPLVALVGRVPVKVTDENGPIAPGDPVTSSSTPGYAMRATEPGYVIGRALESSDTGGGMVRVFVNPGWFNGTSVEVAQNTASSLDVLSAQTINLAGDLYMQGGAISGIGRLLSANGSWSLDETGTLLVTAIETELLTTEELTVRLTNERQIVGEATIPEGQTMMRVNNDLITATSKVFVTFRSRVPSAWWISGVEQGWFEVALENPSSSGDLTFDYWIVRVEDTRPSIAPEPALEPAAPPVAAMPDDPALTTEAPLTVEADPAAPTEPLPTEEPLPADADTSFVPSESPPPEVSPSETGTTP
ncbi:hypothetical protein HY478_00665 [Candidatus Uhrbacteria bacterium]|nr:hypothetical protein [Candidatus Uhrbacteria bacterium]